MEPTGNSRSIKTKKNMNLAGEGQRAKKRFVNKYVVVKTNLRDGLI